MLQTDPRLKQNLTRIFTEPQQGHKLLTTYLLLQPLTLESNVFSQIFLGIIDRWLKWSVRLRPCINFSITWQWCQLPLGHNPQENLSGIVLRTFQLLCTSQHWNSQLSEISISFYNRLSNLQYVQQVNDSWKYNALIFQKRFYSVKFFFNFAETQAQLWKFRLLPKVVFFNETITPPGTHCSLLWAAMGWHSKE